MLCGGRHKYMQRGTCNGAGPVVVLVLHCFGYNGHPIIPRSRKKRKYRYILFFQFQLENVKNYLLFWLLQLSKWKFTNIKNQDLLSLKYRSETHVYGLVFTFQLYWYFLNVMTMLLAHVKGIFSQFCKTRFSWNNLNNTFLYYLGWVLCQSSIQRKW